MPIPRKPYVLKSPAQKTDEELAATAAALVEVINHDLTLGRDIWSAVSALHAHTQEQRDRHYVLSSVRDGVAR